MTRPEFMKGLWLQDKHLEVRDLPVPSPGPGEALLRLRLAGICGTDLEMVRGYYAYTGVPGHEFVADVLEAPDDAFWIGKRVVGEINAACGACETCKALRPKHCEQRTVLGIAGRQGVFAETFTLPIQNLYTVPASVSDAAAVFTEPLAAACQIAQQIEISSDTSVLCIGAGRLGLLIAQVVALTGCDLEVAAKYPVQKEILEKRNLRVIDPSAIPQRTSDVVIESTGDPAGFELAVKAVRPGGTIVLKSTYHGEVQIDFSALVVDEITLIGSRCGPFPLALGLLEQSLVDPTLLVEQSFPLSRATEAFEQAGKPGALKVLLYPDEND